MKSRFLALMSLMAIFIASNCNLEAKQPNQTQKPAFTKRSHSSSSSSSSSQSCRGQQGLRGPRGFQGTPGTCECVPSSLSVYTTTPQTGIPFMGAIIFDQQDIPLQGSAMSYDTSTGTVTFHDTGYYLVTYGVQVDLAPEQNAEFVLFTSSGLVVGSALIIPNIGGGAYSDLLTSISEIVYIAVPESMQVISYTLSSCGTVSTGTQTDCANVPPVVAYLVVNKLA